MSVNKKYYYLKLKDTFFDSEEMKILESQKNGFLYQNLYLKLCLLSIKNQIPYNIDFLAERINMNKDIIDNGLKIMEQYKLINIKDKNIIIKM